MKIEKGKDDQADRRSFLKLGLLAGGAAVAGAVLKSNLFEGAQEESPKQVKVLTADGTLVNVDSSQVKHHIAEKQILSKLNVRDGIEGKRFVMVIDLARCANARKCVSGCQKMHHRRPPVEWMKVLEMQDALTTAPYWMPQPCFHCDNPPCVKVCPVDATFKRRDGIVLIDNERCIGCRICMVACPYNARTFNWGDNWGVDEDKKSEKCCESSPESSCPSRAGTVEKCDFCPDMAREGKLPDCVTACPNGTIFFGDSIEDTVTNGENTFRLSELLKKRGGYRYLEELGTEPRVYYLPPDNRKFPFEKDKEAHNIKE